MLGEGASLPLYAFIDPQPAVAADRRSAPRKALILTSNVGGSTAAVRIVELSASGFVLEGANLRLQPGEQIDVELPEAARPKARVVRQEGGRIACEFDRPLSRASLSAALLRADPAAIPVAKAVAAPNRRVQRLALVALPLAVAGLLIGSGLVAVLWVLIGLAIVGLLAAWGLWVLDSEF